MPVVITGNGFAVDFLLTPTSFCPLSYWMAPNVACGSTRGQRQFKLLDMKSSDTLFIWGRIKHIVSNQFSFCCVFKDNKTTNKQGNENTVCKSGKNVQVIILNLFHGWSFIQNRIKIRVFKKVTKLDEIFTVDLTLTT